MLFKTSEPTRGRVQRKQTLPEALPSYEGLSELPHAVTSLAQLLSQLVNQQTDYLHRGWTGLGEEGRNKMLNRGSATKVLTLDWSRHSTN